MSQAGRVQRDSDRVMWSCVTLTSPQTVTLPRGYCSSNTPPKKLIRATQLTQRLTASDQSAAGSRLMILLDQWRPARGEPPVPACKLPLHRSGTWPTVNETNELWNLVLGDWGGGGEEEEEKVLQTLVPSRDFGENREKRQLGKGGEAAAYLCWGCTEKMRQGLGVEHRATYCSTWKLEAE